MTVIHKRTYIATVQDLHQIWQSVLGQIELQFSPSIVNTWFANSKLEKVTHEQAEISCTSPYTSEILQKRYQATITQHLEQILKYPVSLKFTVRPEEKTENTVAPLFDQNPDLKLNHRKEPAMEEQHNLNTQFIFDNFVVGNCNRVAHAAALAVAHNPGQTYNPLFIHGSSGLGKTHLAHAVGNHLSQNGIARKISYFPVETFINDFIHSIRFNQTAQFRAKYRENDCIIVDDIQFIGGDKISTQEEFFHTFNELYNQGKQIIICSDRPPNEIQKLTDRLVTRFAGGLLVEITPPDYETRLAIIKTKASHLNLEINTETAEIIANCQKDNVREIEGLILKIRSELLVRNLPPNLNNIKNILSSEQQPSPHRPKLSPELIFQLVNERFETSMSQLCSRSRKSEVVIPRQIAMFLLRNDLGLNFEHIGDLLGGRDHTTIMHGVEKIGQQLKQKKPKFSLPVREIRQQMY